MLSKHDSLNLILKDYEQDSLCDIKVKIQLITRKYILDLQTLKSM